MMGRVHSIQSMGTVDGPGVRFVVFLQGCHLRCKCCHNPDTWEIHGGKEYSAEELAATAARYRDYFGATGGITLSGGEPLLQSEFARELFLLCKARGIHTCLDTSGSVINDGVKALLEVTDYVLLDIKYTEEAKYRDHVGCSLETVLQFLELLQQRRIPTTLRQVILPGVNDTDENVLALKAMADAHSVVQKIELLPFKKLCQTKYDAMGIPFPFGELDEPDKACMERLSQLCWEI